MSLFFTDNHYLTLQKLHERMNKLKETIPSGENNSAIHADVTKVMGFYTQGITNGNSDVKNTLLSQYESIIVCYEGIQQSPVEGSRLLIDKIEELKKENTSLPHLERLYRVGSAFEALFWLGVALIASVAIVVSISTIPAAPMSGVFFTAASAGLWVYGISKMCESIDHVFNQTSDFANQQKINSADIKLLEDIQTSYAPPSMM